MNRTKLIFIALGMLLSVVTFAGGGLPSTQDRDSLAVYSEKDIKIRFKEMGGIIKPQYSDVTRKRIKSYVYTRRDLAEKILGKSAVYFPIIEQYLKQYGLPIELRVLPIIEADFDPMAISGAGASGLWQFMQGTAEGMGLKIDDDRDERFDIHRSTEAAVQYLAYLYDKYQDWGLTLAAYNCGPKYVNRAIRRAKSRDYWTVSRYLPRETQRYIPKYLAVSYLVNYYAIHGLSPDLPDLDMQMTVDIRLPFKVCLEEISCLVNVSMTLLETLNPSYIVQCEAADRADGASITLPKRVASFVQGYYAMPIEGRKYFKDTPPVFRDDPSTYYQIYSYLPDSTETISSLASFFNVEESLLRLWNPLPPNDLFDGETEVLIYLPVVAPFHLPKYSANLLPGPSDETIRLDQDFSIDIHQQAHLNLQLPDYNYHVIGFGESMHEVKRSHRLSDVDQITEHNPNIDWVPGNLIRIPKNHVELVDAR